MGDPLDNAEPWDEAQVLREELADDADWAAIDDDEYLAFHPDEEMPWAHDRAATERLATKDDGSGWWSSILQDLCRVAGLRELPHAAAVGDPAFRLPGHIGAAVRAAARAQQADGEMEGGAELADAVAEAVHEYVLEAVAPLIQGYQELRDAHEKMREKVLANQAKAAEARRQKKGWPAKATEIWTAHPTWAVHRVAKEICGPDDHLSSIQRAIKHLKPAT